MTMNVIRFMALSAIIGLSACSSFSSIYGGPETPAPITNPTPEQLNSSTILDPNGNPIPVKPVATTGESIGGNVERGMDNNDRIKMSRALDKAPGTAVTWTNRASGISYTVTPIRKVVLNGNPYCRKYSISASRGGQVSTVSGTACIGESGNWESVSRD